MTRPKTFLALAAVAATAVLAIAPALAGASPGADEYSPSVPTKSGNQPLGKGGGKGSLSDQASAAIDRSNLTPHQKKLLAQIASDPSSDSSDSSGDGGSSSPFRNPLVLAVIFLVLAIAIGLTVARQRHGDDDDSSGGTLRDGGKQTSEQPTTPHGQIVAQREDRAPGGTPGGARAAGTGGNA